MSFPKVMATQHPDSASRYVSVQEEPGEVIECIRDYGCDEYKPDYEGKLTPYHQNAQVVTKLLEETDFIPGKDVFITPRMPSAIHEKAFSQIMAMMSIAEANWKALKYTDTQAIIEVVHPMTQDVGELLGAQERLVDVTNLAKKEFHFKMKVPQIIPLFEGLPPQFNAKKVLKEYIARSEEKLDISFDKFRVFVGKSDSALLFGHVASAFSCKYAISSVRELEKEMDIEIGMIFGGGSLPFRGHVTLENIENVLREYPGIDTITLQSGLRYDHGIEKAREFIKIVKKKLPTEARFYSQDEKREIIEIAGILAKTYIKTLYRVADAVKKVAELLPNQRDRLTTGGVIGYSRNAPDLVDFSKRCRWDTRKELLEIQAEESLELPRAIKFTGALYSIGVPPEIIGTGRGLLETKEKLGEDAFEKTIGSYYPSLEADLDFSMRFLNLEMARSSLPSIAYEDIKRDVEILSEYFELEADETKEHRTYVAMMEMTRPYLTHLRNGTMHVLGDEPLRLTERTLLELGKMRKSLG
jgi:phosphoenolpyruvate carboxylase